MPSLPTNGHDLPPPLPSFEGSEADVRSLARHVCPECGGKGEWDAAKRKLVCPYCGTVFERVGPAPLPSEIVEHDLMAELQRLGSGAETWDRGTRRVQCTHCHAVLVRAAGTVAQHCDFCGTPELLDYNEIEAPIRPESLLPAQIGKEQAYHALKQFLGGRWFAPNDLRRRNLVDALHGIYLPYWTFDAHADCPWEAESGYYYWETESYRDAQGNTQTRQVRKTRWEHSEGRIEWQFDDVLVAASGAMEPKLLAELEPFPTKDVVPYETSYVSGWQVEQYQVPLKEAAVRGAGFMEGMLREMCGREVPGDTYRSLQIYPQFSEQTFKHILAPIWMVTYQYRGKTWRGAVNAITGKVSAEFPISPWKVALVILLVIAVVILILSLSR